MSTEDEAKLKEVYAAGRESGIMAMLHSLTINIQGWTANGRSLEEKFGDVDEGRARELAGLIVTDALECLHLQGMTDRFDEKVRGYIKTLRGLGAIPVVGEAAKQQTLEAIKMLKEALGQLREDLGEANQAMYCFYADGTEAEIDRLEASLNNKD